MFPILILSVSLRMWNGGIIVVVILIIALALKEIFSSEAERFEIKKFLKE